METIKTDLNVYGYVNGKAVYSRDEFIFASRGFGAIENDADLLAYAEKVTSNWYDAGWHRTFTSYYLSDYALSEPGRSLTKAEYARLKEMQAAAQAEQKRIEAEKDWRLKETICYADNSVEEIYENKYGERRIDLVVYPHGDCC